MLMLIHNLKDICYEQLMRVYAQAIAENGEHYYPRKGHTTQVILAEQDLYEYFRIMLQDPNAHLAVWTSHDRYEAVLRLEPYHDGLLIAGLETAPEARCRGYATSLLLSVVQQFSSVRLYSHINKQNMISLHIHEKCGFQRVSDRAVYLDGSVSSDAYTYIFDS